MIKNLTNEQLISIDNTAVIDFNKYRQALNVASKDLDQYKDIKNLCLLGVARGGLPFMIGVSHFSGIRNVSSLQVQMNKSDERADYGEAFLLSGEFDMSYDNYIIFEDIIYKGKSINQAVQLLKQKNKNVLAIYSLVIDENYIEDTVFEYDDIPVKYVYEVHKDDWVYFPWEKGYPDTI